LDAEAYARRYRRRRAGLLGPIVGLLLAGCAPDAPPSYVGSSECQSCHENAYDAWRGSHHDLAMDSATAETVLGDFDDATFTYADITSTFSTRDGRYFVRTDGPVGELADYEITYVFGFDPLQQYLIRFPDGRLQTLGLAWDERSTGQGGQRWFHLYPGDSVLAGHPLHWTSRDQAWNYQCAECHSTNLQRGYDAATDTYETTWSEIDVACEACHGPGSAHVAWAAAYDADDGSDLGLVTRLGSLDAARWEFEPGSIVAHRTAPRVDHTEVESCARCHARRGLSVADYEPGGLFLQTHMPSLLLEGLYEPDGQILDEVYVYGSFIQSKMYQAGVTCSDCHDPHSPHIASDPNAMCSQCHLASAYDAVTHSFHDRGDNVGCVDCHMVPKTYMVVDPRRDHSFRIPRPDLSAAIGTSNACSNCHVDRSNSWAAAAVRQWYPNGVWTEAHFGEVIAAARAGNPAVSESLFALVRDTSVAGIVRGTAATLLQRFPSRGALAALEVALEDDDPIVRLGAVRAVDFVPPQERARILFEPLVDSVLVIRILAARGLTAVPREALGVSGAIRFDSAFAEYVEAQLVNGERPEAHLNIGTAYLEMGDGERAEASFRTAIERDSTMVESYVNLADLYRALNRDTEGEIVLRTGLTIDPDAPALHHALGLWFVRRSLLDSAVVEFRIAADVAPESARYSYVHAVALHSAGRSGDAVRVLETAARRHPYDRDILLALATTNLEMGELEDAARHATRFAELYPDDPRALSVMQAIRQADSR